MNVNITILVAALCAVEVLSSQYHGPTARPQVLHNGYLTDTHEVAAAKSNHLATLALQSHGHVYGNNGDDHSQGSSFGREHHHEDDKYNGPTAIPHVLHDGHIADTHEVAAAKAAHFAAVAKAKAHGGYSHHGSYSSVHHLPYHGLLAMPVVLKSGYLADTHEVAAAKQRHLHALHSSHVSVHGHSLE